MGVEALRAWNPERHGDLSVTAANKDPLTGDPIDIPTSPSDAGAEDPRADPLSWDITSQVGQSLLHNDKVVG